MNPKNRFAKTFAVILLILMGVANVHAAVNINYVVNNHLGAPVLLVDENQHVVWQAEYDEFGKATILVEEVEFNVRFPGQYYDKETGLTYNYYRDYDPSLGRYVQSDPRGTMLDFSDPQRQVAARMGVAIPQNNRVGYVNHTYGYVDQNPVSRTDKTGESVLCFVPEIGWTICAVQAVVAACIELINMSIAATAIVVATTTTVEQENILDDSVCTLKFPGLKRVDGTVLCVYQCTSSKGGNWQVEWTIPGGLSCPAVVKGGLKGDLQ